MVGRLLLVSVVLIVGAGLAVAQEDPASACLPAACDPAGGIVGEARPDGAQAAVAAAFGKLPLYFVENRGQYPETVAFSIQGADKTLHFTREGITFRLRGKERGWVVKLDFIGADPDAAPRGEERQKAIFSYFKGPETAWKAGLRTYAKVVYRDLWPGIDLVYAGTVNQLKYEFLVRPGADPAKIRLQYRGAESVEVTESGTLRVGTPAGALEDAAPVAWQEIDGKRVPVAMAFRLAPGTADDGTTFGFDVGRYDPAHRLVLDPAVIVYCGYIGGSGSDIGQIVAVDAAGAAYVTADTASTEQTFPIAVGPDLTHNGGTNDAFVAKIDPTGTSLVYCGYIGGSGDDRGRFIAVDSAGSAYVIGYTGSNEQTFPVKNGPDLTHNGGLDVFVAKVNPQGTALVYCGYLGGSASDYGLGIAVDAAGNAHVSGYTASTEQTFPVKVGPDLTHNGGNDAFVAKIDSSGTSLVYCGYVGGSGADAGYGVRVDAAGNAFVGGYAASNEQSFPVTIGPDLTHNGAIDAFVAKVNPQGTALTYCGYVGGSGNDYCLGVALDAGGSAYLGGYTASSEQTFPVLVGPDLTYNGGTYDAFVAKVNTAGSALDYCGYIGGSGLDYGQRVAVDAAGNLYLVGHTDSTEQTFPVAGGPNLKYNGGTYDSFIAKVSGTCSLGGSGSPTPGGQVNLSLSSSTDAGRVYQLGSSFGNGPIAIDTRKLELSPDALLFLSVLGSAPGVFSNYAGVLDGQGQAKAAIHLPSIPALKTIRIYTAFVTLKATAPSGISSISGAFVFTIQ